RRRRRAATHSPLPRPREAGRRAPARPRRPPPAALPLFPRPLPGAPRPRAWGGGPPAVPRLPRPRDRASALVPEPRPGHAARAHRGRAGAHGGRRGGAPRRGGGVRGRGLRWGIWVTGPPPSRQAASPPPAPRAPRRPGRPVTVLELDEIRRSLTPEPRYTEDERDGVYHALAYFARLLTAAGRPVIIDATAHRRAWRDRARAVMPRFAEVQLLCPLP